MTMTKSIFPLLFAALLLAVFSCKRSAPPLTAVFPEAGARLSAEEAEEIVFRWDTTQINEQARNARKSSQNEDIQLDSQMFRLYRFESIENQNGKDVFLFSLLKEEKIIGNSPPIFRTQNQQSTRVYVWEIFREDENGRKHVIQKLTPFTVENPQGIPVTTEENSRTLSMFINGCPDCVRQPNECQNLICWNSHTCGARVHIATLIDFDIFDREYVSLNTDPSSISNNDSTPCIDPSGDSVKLYVSFNVHVPCEKLSILKDTTKTLALLFKGDTLVENGPSFFPQFSLNDRAENAESLFLDTTAYLKYCKGESGDSLVCRAKIELDASFRYEPNNVYTLVLYLSEEYLHNHGMTTYANQNPRTRIVPHTHSVMSLPNCPPDDKTLPYYTCRDSLTDLHVSQHIIIIHLNQYICHNGRTRK